jgi:hypothetical protein
MKKGDLLANCNWENSSEPRAVWATEYLERPFGDYSADITRSHNLNNCIFTISQHQYFPIQINITDSETCLMYLSFSQLHYWETIKIQLQLLSLWVGEKKLQKVHKIVKFILCIYTGTRSFLHCTLTPTLTIQVIKREGEGGVSIFFVIRTWRCVSTVNPTGVNRKF